MLFFKNYASFNSTKLPPTTYPRSIRVQCIFFGATLVAVMNAH